MKDSLEYKSFIFDKGIRLFLRLLVLLSSSSLVFLGNTFQDNNLIFFGIILAFTIFTVQYLYNLKENIIILLFNLSIFIFLLGRYFVRMLSNTPMDVAPEYTSVSLNLVFISLITINVTYYLISKKKKTNVPKILEEDTKNFINRVSLFANAGFLITGACAAITALSLYEYLQRYGYTSLYLSPDLPLPPFITVLADMLPFFVALCLARLPNKKTSYIILASYLLLQLPLLLAGRRMPFIIAMLVWITYVVLRHYRTHSIERWIGKLEKVAIAIVIPIVIIIVPLVGDLRGGTVHSQDNALERTLDSQGVTLDVVSYGVKFQEETPNSIYGSYTFAPLIDYMSTNFISRALFNTEEIPAQTEESAESGKSYPDTISYLVLWSNLYLAGQGLGSSYIVEPYIDFGVWGVIIYSIFLAILIRWMISNFGRGYLRTFLIILLMINIYALPRDTATGFIVAMLQIQVVLLLSAAFFYERFINDFRRV